VKFTYFPHVAPGALAAEISTATELTPTFGIRGIRRSLIEAAEQGLEVDAPECRNGRAAESVDETKPRPKPDSVLPGG